ncbi:MAG: MATE family efflux transporter [Oscillospiraceae bacterium]|nr:MATE family efflux transporter [Oscillospiraceae bacterium]
MNTAAKKSLDLTRGDPLKLLIRFAIPMLIGSVFQLMYNMVDTVVLGKFVSAEALASVGAAGSTHGMFLMVSNAITNAMSILISQAWGARDGEQVRRIVSHAMVLVLGCSAVFGALAFFAAGPLMGLLGTPDNIIAGSVTYIRITCGLMVTSLMYNASAAILRAIGDSRTPLYFLILCSLLNIVLDIAFVFTMENGVAAVAWATIISQSVSSILCITYMWRKYPELRFGRAHLRLQKKILSSFTGISIPMLLQSLSLSIGMMVITSVINSFGSDVVAAFTVGSKVEQLVVVAFSQVAFSFSVYSGQNFGAKLYDRISLGLKKAGILLGCLIPVSMCIEIIFARSLALLFLDSSSTGILDLAVQMIRVEGCFLPALGTIWLTNSCLRGMGIIKPTIISGFTELFAKIGLSILLSSLFGPVGIWFAAPIGWVIGIIPGAVYYFFSGWKEKAIEKDGRAAGRNT